MAAAEKDAALRRFDVVEGQLLVKVYRAGRLARLGHNHTIEAPIHGWFTVAGTQVQAELFVRPSELAVDRPETRAAQGEAFSKPVKPEDVEGTRGNLLSEAVLNPLAHPFVRASIDSSRDSDGAVTVAFELAGKNATKRVYVEQLGDDPCRPDFRGAVTLSHQDFGLTPFSILGGAVAVAEEFEVSFELVGQPESRVDPACQEADASSKSQRLP